MYIYKTTNKINNKSYIGLSTKLPVDSKRYLGSGVYLNNAIAKYGKENFIKEIIHDDIAGIEELKYFERFYIDKFDTLNNGYNLTLGGDGCFGFKFSEAQKAENRQKLQEYYRTPEGRKTKEAISSAIKEYYKNHDNPFKGKIHSKEVCEKISAKNKSFYRTDAGKRVLEKNAELNRTRVCSQETRDKMIRSRTGSKRPEATKIKMSKTRTEYYKTHKHFFCGKPAWNRGVAVTEEVRLKISKSATGKVFTEEHRNNMKKAQAGKITVLDIRLNKIRKIPAENYRLYPRRYYNCNSKVCKQWRKEFSGSVDPVIPELDRDTKDLTQMKKRAS